MDQARSTTIFCLPHFWFDQQLAKMPKNESDRFESLLAHIGDDPPAAAIEILGNSAATASNTNSSIQDNLDEVSIHSELEACQGQPDAALYHSDLTFSVLAMEAHLVWRGFDPPSPSSTCAAAPSTSPSTASLTQPLPAIPQGSAPTILSIPWPRVPPHLDIASLTCSLLDSNAPKALKPDPLCAHQARHPSQTTPSSCQANQALAATPPTPAAAAARRRGAPDSAAAGPPAKRGRPDAAGAPAFEEGSVGPGSPFLSESLPLRRARGAARGAAPAPGGTRTRAA
jgi:hypothetical protein